MNKSEFENYTFYFPRSSDSGTTGSEYKKISDYLSFDEDIYNIDENNSRSIILKSGINKLIQKLEFESHGYNAKYVSDPSYGLTIFVKYKFFDKEKKCFFFGDGETNCKNTAGISAQYPLAMAIKRAKSRAILEYLNLDFYSEDESPDFSPNQNKLGNLDKEKIIKLSLIDEVKKNALKLQMDNTQLKTYIKNLFKMDSDSKLKLSDLTIDSCLAILFSFKIKEVFGDNGLNEYLKTIN
jgi:hypothetical protein